MQTSRTSLRRLRLTDYDHMRTLESALEVMRFTPARLPQSPQQTQDRLSSQIQKQPSFEPFGIWLAEELHTQSLVGWFMLMPKATEEVELGFMLAPSQWGKGFATEVGQELLRYAKEHGVKLVTAKTDTDNFSSMRVLEKLGFQYVENTQAPDLKIYQFAVK